MAYVPPHLKNKQSSLESTAQSPFYSLQDLSSYLDCPIGSLSTITESPVSPDVLAAILLYDGQHPDWTSAHTLLCKSNLNVLRKIVDDRARKQDASAASNLNTLSAGYPLFSEVPFFKHGSSNKFEFAGWWRIANVQFLEPNSKELVAHFEKKFNGQGTSQGRKRFSESFTNNPDGLRIQRKLRSKEAWKDSLSKEWALVSLKKNEERKDVPTIRTALPSSGDVSSIQRGLHNGEARLAPIEADVPETILHHEQGN